MRAILGLGLLAAVATGCALRKDKKPSEDPPAQQPEAPSGDGAAAAPPKSPSTGTATATATEVDTDPLRALDGLGAAERYRLAWAATEAGDERLRAVVELRGEAVVSLFAGGLAPMASDWYTWPTERREGRAQGQRHALFVSGDGQALVACHERRGVEGGVAKDLEQVCRFAVRKARIGTPATVVVEALKIDGRMRYTLQMLDTGEDETWARGFAAAPVALEEATGSVRIHCPVAGRSCRLQLHLPPPVTN